MESELRENIEKETESNAQKKMLISSVMWNVVKNTNLEAFPNPQLENTYEQNQSLHGAESISFSICNVNLVNCHCNLGRKKSVIEKAVESYGNAIVRIEQELL